MHAHQMAHLDVKPENIFITQDDAVVKLGDFGVAKVLEHTMAKASHHRQVEIDGDQIDAPAQQRVEGRSGQPVASSAERKEAARSWRKKKVWQQQEYRL